MNEKIEAKLKLLPDKPGVYKMFNARGELIYVGKAINLKNRVRQYFQSSKIILLRSHQWFQILMILILLSLGMRQRH